MSQDTNNKNLVENKILILYVLNEINKDITNDSLFDIISSINNLNYFYFQQYLDDLINSKFIGKYTKDEECVLQITAEGKKSLDFTISLLPGIIKLDANTVLKEKLPSIEDASSISSEYFPIDEENYIIKCKIIENNETVFEIKTVAGSREMATKITDNWNNNAYTLYPKLLNIVLENEE